MIFVEFFGPESVFRDARSGLQAQIAAVFRTRPEEVVLRRIPAETDYAGAEIWIELSSEEQLARHGRDLAREVTAVVKRVASTDAWVLFRVVPLERVYLNGEPRARGIGPS